MCGAGRSHEAFQALPILRDRVTRSLPRRPHLTSPPLRPHSSQAVCVLASQRLHAPFWVDNNQGCQLPAKHVPSFPLPPGGGHPPIHR